LVYNRHDVWAINIHVSEAIGQATDETFAAYGPGDIEGFVRHCAGRHAL